MMYFHKVNALTDKQTKGGYLLRGASSHHATTICGKGNDRSIDVRFVFVVWRGYSHPRGPQGANRGNKIRTLFYHFMISQMIKTIYKTIYNGELKTKII